MRLLILSNNDAGLWLFRRELLERLLEEGHRVYISVPAGGDVARLRGIGCKVTTCDMLQRRGKNPAQDLELLHYYRRLIARVQPDATLSYTIKPNVYGGIACRLARVPFFANVTGLGDAVERGGALAKLTLAMYREGLRGARCVFFQNRENLDRFQREGIVHGRTRLIPGSGVNLDAFTAAPYPQDASEIRVLFVGRILKDKGIEELLTVAARLRKEAQEDDALAQEKPRFAIDVVGDCDENYQARLQTAQADGAITYHAAVSDVRPFYEKAHCVVLPTYHEGMSNVLQEAAACARPALASNVSGCKEIVDDGNTGLLFSPKSADALYDAMRRFAALHADIRAEMGRQARLKMEREFDRRIVVDAYLEELKRLERRNG